MDFENIEALFEFGFFGGISVAELQLSCTSLPEVQGIYLVVRALELPVIFLETSSGGRFRRRNPTVPISELKRNWLSRPKVLYIGKAGGRNNQSTIQKRVCQLVRFGGGEPCGHWGGRYIWQLTDAQDLMIYWTPTPDQDPRQIERVLINEFKEKYGQLPFANLRR